MNMIEFVTKRKDDKLGAAFIARLLSVTAQKLAKEMKIECDETAEFIDRLVEKFENELTAEEQQK